MYETFDHTADLGIRVRADSLDELFAEAGQALFSTILDNLEEVHDHETTHFSINGDDLEYLFFDWLNALLFEFDAENRVFRRFSVHVTEHGLTAIGYGEKLDRTRHELSHEVKAITYHDLTVRKDDRGYLAEVIVDI